MTNEDTCPLFAAVMTQLKTGAEGGRRPRRRFVCVSNDGKNRVPLTYENRSRFGAQRGANITLISENLFQPGRQRDAKKEKLHDVIGRQDGVFVPHADITQSKNCKVCIFVRAVIDL
jgi:hypothetical protein